MQPIAVLSLHVVALGVGATLSTDAWAWLRRRVFGVASPEWGLVGRWLAHLRRGRFVHAGIRASAPVRGERAIGWIAHYLTGIVFAAVFVAWGGPAWLHSPTLLPALLFGLATVAAPFLVLQPGMGAGLAARRAPRPWHSRLHSIATHLVFGGGLYLAAVFIRSVHPSS